MKNRLGSALVAACLFLPGCSDVGPADELSAARKRWELWGPATYDVVVSRYCECTQEMAGPVQVSVRNLVVESRRYVSSGEAVREGFAPNFPDVPGLFELIASAIRDGELADVEYDAETGLPASIMLDLDGPETNGVDGEISIGAVLVSPARHALVASRR